MDSLQIQSFLLVTLQFFVSSSACNRVVSKRLLTGKRCGIDAQEMVELKDHHQLVQRRRRRRLTIIKAIIAIPNPEARE